MSRDYENDYWKAQQAKDPCRQKPLQHLLSGMQGESMWVSLKKSKEAIWLEQTELGRNGKMSKRGWQEQSLVVHGGDWILFKGGEELVESFVWKSDMKLIIWMLCGEVNRQQE